MRRLATEVDERRNPRMNATVDQLLDRHFELALAELEVNTLANYRGLAEKHIRSLIGSVKVGALDGDLFDSFYATLRRCQDHCDRRGCGWDDAVPLTDYVITRPRRAAGCIR